MRFTSSLLEKIGGRLGQYVGMMNRSGMNLRQWVVPSNPNSSAKQGVRNTLRALAAAWSSTLTSAQRDAWTAYAATLTFTSSLGTTYTISGFDAYVAANGAREVAGLSRISAAPVTPGFATFTPVTPSFNVSAHTLSVAYTAADEWNGEVGGGLVIRLSPIGFKAGVTFYKGPFKYAGVALGAVSPPASPKVITLAAGVFATGTQYAIAVRSVRADGRFSQEAIFRGLGV